MQCGKHLTIKSDHCIDFSKKPPPLLIDRKNELVEFRKNGINFDRTNNIYFEILSFFNDFLSYENLKNLKRMNILNKIKI